MYKQFRRLLCAVLVLVLVCNLLPLQIFATEINSLGSITTDTDAQLQPTAPVELVELPHKRDEYTKEYIAPGGNHIAAVYPEAVHYEKDGIWEEIDNTLKLSKDGAYQNTAGIWNVRFPSQLTKDNAISVTKDGYTLSFAMAGQLSGSQLLVASTGAMSVAEATASTAQLRKADLSAARKAAEYPELVLEKLTSGLLYENIYGTADIRYDLTSNKIKESVILENYDANLLGYRYTLQTGGLTPVLRENGSIEFFGAGKDPVMVMQAPYLVDAAMEHNFDVTVELTGSDGTYSLTYLLPTSWLANKERQWPVVLDPVITANLHYTNVRDVTVTEKGGSRYLDGIIECGHCKVEGIQRFFLKYNQIPALSSSDTVIAANLRLYKLQTSGTTATVQVHKVLGTWASETINWSNKPGFDTNIEDMVTCRELGYYNWDVTDIVRGWYAGENTGMMFKTNTEVENSTINNWKQFCSSDYSDSAVTMPALSIVFRNSNGLESYWDYTAASAGRAGTGYINSYTGNLVLTRGDMGFGGNRMPVSIQFVYNANDAGINDFAVGAGWQTNYHQTVKLWNQDNSYYVWNDADGTDHYFKNESGTYKDEDDLELTLTVNGSGTEKYCITDKYGNKSFFDTAGRLTKLQNNQATPSSITITYTDSTNNRIYQVKDGANRVYSFTYNSSNLLTRISYEGSGSEELSYVSYGYTGKNLTSVTYKDGKSCAYTYNSTGQLLTAQDIDGYKLTYTYNLIVTGKPARIASVTESHNGAEGGVLTIAYAHNQTTFTDYQGNKEILQFNNMGNTVSIQDGEGRAQFAQYTKNEASGSGKGNQLTKASKLQNTVSNLLSDSSMESGSTWTVLNGSGSRAISTTQAYQGGKALAVTNGLTLEAASFTAEANSTYTFSLYVKTVGTSAKLQLVCGNDVAESVAVPAENGWSRLEVAYTNTAGTQVTLSARLVTEGTGTTYADCAQLEKQPTASRYNLIENGDFRHSTTGWTNSGGFTAATQTAAAPTLSSNVYGVTGAPASQKRMSQTVKVSGNAGDNLVLSGWAKGNSVPLTGDRQFAIIGTFNYTDGTPKTFTAQFNPDMDGNYWQYSAQVMVAEKAYSSVKVELAYDYNANTAYFDGIQLFREEYGSTYTYDEDGNVTSVQDLQKQTTSYEYTDNDLTKQTLPTGAELTYEYDSYHNVTRATTEEGQVYEFTYDAWGNNTSVSIVSGTDRITSTATYSADGNRLLSTTDALGKVTTYDYDPDTMALNWVKYPEDTDATKTSYTYDDMYRTATAAATTDTGLQQSVAYTYSNDLLTAIQTPSTTYNFTYGNFALRTKVMVGSQTLATYSYENRTNRLTALAYGNGDSVQYEYDDQGRTTKQTYEDGDTVTYTYDNNGALATVTDSATGIKTTYYYDFTDRIVKTVESGANYSHSVGYEYDTINNVTAIVETINGVDRTTSYTYDDDNRVTSTTTGNASVHYTYDAYGRITQQVTKNGSTTVLTESFTYIPNSTRVSTYATTAGGITTTYTYTYDDNGNIATIHDGTYTTTYTYDSANQLIREDNQQRNETYIWEYDAAGNLLNRTDCEYSETDDLCENQSYPYQYSDTEWGDVLTGYFESTEFYSVASDEIGNVTTITQPENGIPTTWVYTWEHGRQLASLSWDDLSSELVTTWSFEYNSNGLRTARTDGTTTYNYIYNGAKLVQMTVDGHTLYFSYDAIGTPVSVNFDGTEYFYTTNLQGDVVGIVDNTGTTVVTYRYSAWGAPEWSDGTTNATLKSLNPLRYRGYVYDQETSLYYLQSRYYNPTWGRFINADVFVSTGQKFSGCNMYLYCLNNPANYYDDKGTDAVLLYDEDFPGHIGILVEDEDGNWWHFYWGAESAGSISSAKLFFGINDEVNTWCKPYSGDLTLAEINNSGQYGEDYEKMVWLTGDFSGCIDKMKTVEGTYNLFNRNCSQVSLSILAQADTIYREILNSAKGKLLPSQAYHTVKFYVDILPILKPIAQKAIEALKEIMS